MRSGVSIFIIRCGGSDQPDDCSLLVEPMNQSRRGSTTLGARPIPGWYDVRHLRVVRGHIGSGAGVAQRIAGSGPVEACIIHSHSPIAKSGIHALRTWRYPHGAPCPHPDHASARTDRHRGELPTELPIFIRSRAREKQGKRPVIPGANGQLAGIGAATPGMSVALVARGVGPPAPRSTTCSRPSRSAASTRSRSACSVRKPFASASSPGSA